MNEEVKKKRMSFARFSKKLYTYVCGKDLLIHSAFPFLEKKYVANVLSRGRSFIIL